MARVAAVDCGTNSIRLLVAYVIEIGQQWPFSSWFIR